MRTKFLIAEEVSLGAEGKHSVRGLFSDDTIVVTLPRAYTEGPETLPPGLDILTCLLSVAGLPNGKHRIKGHLIDPRGNSNAETPAIDFEIANNNSHSFPFHLRPFIITGGAGTYTWNFRLDNQEFTHTFEVRLLKARN